MTAQVPDTLEVDDVRYSLVGIAGTGLFDPNDHGAEPRMMHTGCWRGFVCHYVVRGAELHLGSLDLGAGSTIDGAQVAPGTPWLGSTAEVAGGTASYRFASRLVRFTGTLLGGDRFVRATYVHMGFQSPWQYERVAELAVEAGRVTARRDRSAEMADLRRSIQDRERDDPDGVPGSPGWIARRFSRGVERTTGDPLRPPGC